MSRSSIKPINIVVDPITEFIQLFERRWLVDATKKPVRYKPTSRSQNKKSHSHLFLSNSQPLISRLVSPTVNRRTAKTGNSNLK